MIGVWVLIIIILLQVQPVAVSTKIFWIITNVVQNYSPNDNIYLLGFSRGAYTVRALSGLINNCGTLKRVDGQLSSQAWKIYKTPLAKNQQNGANVKNLVVIIAIDLKIRFIGLWDTVGAFDIPLSIMSLFDSHDEYYDSKMGSSVRIASHWWAPTRFWTHPVDLYSHNWLKVSMVFRSTADIGGSYTSDKNTLAQCHPMYH